MSDRRPAFYAPTGSLTGDFVSLLHAPYTLWHLSYVPIGAALAAELDWFILGGTLVAFAVGLGVGAHALDEVKSRPLGTRISDRALWSVGIGAMLVSLAIAVIGSFVVSPWVLLWAIAGIFLAVGYALEWPFLHSDVGFGLAWGAFPLLVGYWAQTMTITLPVIVMAAMACLLSLAQRALSTPARFVRRRTGEAVTVFDGERSWDRGQLLQTWEKPLRLLTWTTVTLAIGLLLTHV
ncbi:MAG TPA: hypothetical protein VE027_03080 [Acidimicrobiia bacterium]|nr:hypothetical protein [Acidimicrobiia bacterium]HYJ23963.1 hypothetical protein [Acidimicrobiia bacterium]